MTLKMKIGGADLTTDLKRIEAALSLVGLEGSWLCVDVNGKYRHATNRNHDTNLPWQDLHDSCG